MDSPESMNTDLDHSHQGRRDLARVTMQNLADDICGSVPFFLGTKTQPGTDDKPDVEYPYTTSKASKALRRGAAGSGGYNLIEPYHAPLSSVLAVTTLRAGQKEWVFGQLSRIARLYALNWSATEKLTGQPQQGAGPKHQSFDWQDIC